MTESTATPGQRVFISYRRSDCQPQANGLHDGLAHRLPRAKVFMDIDSIPPGADFEKHVQQEITRCDLVLVMIGDNWLEAAEAGSRRIDNPHDFVRLEIESALATPSVKILPVLVEGAAMPKASDLPESIADIARINAIELSDTRWTSDIARLADFVETLDGSVPAPAPVVVHPPVAAGGTGATVAGWAMVALPLVTVGFLGFLSPLWAAFSVPNEPRFRNRMVALSVGLAVCVVLGITLVTVAPKNADGRSTGPANAVGVLLLVASALVGCGIGIMALVRRHARPSAHG